MSYDPALRSAHRYQLPSADPPVREEPDEEPDFSAIIDTLLRRKVLFLAIFLSFFGLIALITLLTPRSYTATTKLIAGAGGTQAASGDTSLPLLNALLAASGTQSAETYVDLVQQYPVAQDVVRNLNLSIGPRSLLQQISVKPVTNTSILELAATWRDPGTAAKIANEFAAVFVSRERVLVAGQAASALDFLSQEMPSAELRMHAADAALAKFEAMHPDVYTGNGASDSSVLVAQQKFAQAQVDREQAQAQLSSVALQLSSISPTINGSSNIVENPVTSQLRTQLSQVQVQYESARQQFTDQHPSVLALREQIAQLKAEINRQASTIVAGNNIVPNPVYQQLNQQAAGLRTQIAGDTAQLEMLKGELGQMNGVLNSLPVKGMQLANLQRKAKMAEDVFTALQQKYNEATVAKT
ncbi:MAG TPA: hypothetical protein VN860_07005, partial [Candidatus Acidoferrales bacterium]|nr:hypothetical protein [Candidatus Acidoferrales bacterium]